MVPLPIITVGTLNPEQSNMNKNGDARWIKGTIRLIPACRNILQKIGQRKLPFTFVTGQVLPPNQVIIMGEIVEYPIPSSKIIWKTLEIQRILTSESPVFKTLDVTFKDACGLVAAQNSEFLEKLGSIRMLVRKQLTDLLGTKNKFADILIEHFNEKAYDKLISNPWEMIHIVPYYTMSHADAVAEKVGLDKSSPDRFYAYFRQLLDQSFNSHRNTYINENEFRAFYWMHFSEELSMETYEKLAVTAKSPIIKSEMGYHPAHLFFAEKASYRVVLSTLNSPFGLTETETNTIKQVISESEIELTHEQIHALTYGFHHPLHIITGGPGTGKTTILRAILRKLEILTGVSPKKEYSPFLLIAPTAKAAFRMQEQTGVVAYTIHSAFGILPEYGCVDVEGTAKRLKHIKYIIIDEASMLDTKLFGDMCLVLREMDHLPFLLLVGDINQLPPVGHGQVLNDLLAYVEKYYPSYATRLTILKRQGEESNIPELADMVKNGQFPNAEWFQDKSDIIFVPVTATNFRSVLCDNVLKPKTDQLETIQLLTPYRNGAGEDTIHSINRMVAPIYNPMTEGEQMVGYGDPPRQFRVGDKVINKANLSNRVINGSIGEVVKISNSSQDIFDWTIYVEYDGEVIPYIYGDWRLIEPAYAITIHASQGSEYDNVVLIMVRGNNNMDFLTRNLLHVAVSRPTKRLVLMGQISIFSRVAATPQKPRFTALAYWLEHTEQKGEFND